LVLVTADAAATVISSHYSAMAIAVARPIAVRPSLRLRLLPTRATRAVDIVAARSLADMAAAARTTAAANNRPIRANPAAAVHCSVGIAAARTTAAANNRLIPAARAAADC
jgi:hypothetical protein